MAHLNNSSCSQDFPDVNVKNIDKLKLLIEASNKKRLRTSLEKQNISSLDKKNSEDNETLEIDSFNKPLSGKDYSNSSKSVKSTKDLEISRNTDDSVCKSVLLENNESFVKIHDNLDSMSLDCAQSNLDGLLNEYDSDDLLCAISMEKNESFDDSDDDEHFIRFSTLPPHSDSNYLNFDDLSLWEKQKVLALQIGNGIPEPVLNAEEVGFSNHVVQILKEIKFFGPSCIQSVVWPSIIRGRNIVAIAPPHSGKTVSYVLPLVSRLTSGKSFKGDIGPIALILCSSWVKAQAVHDYFKLFLRSFKAKIITLCTEGGNYKNKMQFLINQCDILIATPYCLLKYFEKKAISLSRLQNFILDDASNIMDKHKKELKKIILYMIESRNKSACTFEMLLCAERWNKDFQIIIDKVMSNPVLFFTSFLEAAIYSKIPISAHVYSTIGEKKMALLGMVKNAGKVIIFTTNVSDSLEIQHFLRRFQCKSYLVNEEMEHYLMEDVIKAWKSDQLVNGSLCLIITDQCLIKLCISYANCLIHYDIPSKSRLQFGNRFSCIAEHFTVKEQYQKCVCHILLMESEHYFASHLIGIIENTETPSEKLLELCKKQNEDIDILADLCHYMKAFGCCKEKYCRARHDIDPTADKPQVIPCEGDLHGLVTHIIDASHYYIRVIKYLDPVSNNTVSLNKVYARIGFQLRDFYMHVSEEMKVEKPIVGHCYIHEGENKVFYRIQILEFFPETLAKLEEWKILYLDEGWIKRTNKLNLYKITDQIELPEPLAVEVYLCNVMTQDSCLDWNPQTSFLVSDLIKGKEVHGKIVLCIGKTLWLDPFAVAVKFPDGVYVYPFKVNQKLFDYGHARKNDKHLSLLYKACIDKIPLPRVTKAKEKVESVETVKSPVKYAFLDDSEDYEDVYVSGVVSPSQLYVQKSKFVECLDKLLDKINLQVEQKKLKKASTLYKDMICIAPFHEDNRFYRAIITDITLSNEIQLFYVDFGDMGKAFRNDIYCLPEEFLMLPFQAIECELAGIVPPHGGWSQSAVNALITKTRDEAFDMKILLLKAYHKKSSYTGGNHYVIDLWDGEKKISEQLLQAGFGLPADMPIEAPLKPNPQVKPNEVFNLDEKYSSSSEDEELDPEDKAITAQFYGVLAKMVAEEYNLYPKPATITEISSDEEEILKKSKVVNIPLSDGEHNLNELLPNLTNFKKDELSSAISSDCIRPLITWWDIPEELNILIMVKDVKIYQLDVTDEGLNFSTIVAGIQYSTEENFYEKVQSQVAKTFQSAQGINIIVKKKIPFKWPRFTKEKKKFFHIKYDLIHIDDSDSEEPPKDTYSEKMRYLYDGDNDSSSTDDDETYVEPWNEFAQTKDIYSQLL